MKPSFLPCAAVIAGLTPLLTGVVCAQPGAAPAVSDKEYKLVHKSSFEGTLDDRSPFWPIGWKPTPAGPALPDAPRTEKVPEFQADAFVITTISLEREGALAVINGRTHAVGDHLPIDASGLQYVTVKQIIDGAVIFDYHGKPYRVNNVRRGPGGK